MSFLGGATQIRCTDYVVFERDYRPGKQTVAVTRLQHTVRQPIWKASFDLVKLDPIQSNYQEDQYWS